MSRRPSFRRLRPFHGIPSINPRAIIARLTCVLWLTGAIVGSSFTTAWAQSGEQKPADKQAPAEQAKDGQRKVDELAEAAKAISGPAGNPECVWLGRRVVNLLWRDDLDTAFRHLDLYDRFGCPGGHIQAAFRCVVRQGSIDLKDPKSQDTLSARVQACWINPSLQPAAAGSPAAGTPGP